MNEETEVMRPVSMVLTLPDPDKMKASSYVEVGGTMQWRTESHQYTEFEIEFIGRNPLDDSKSLKLTGDDLNPVVLRMTTANDDYSYMLRQRKPGGPWKETGPFAFSVKSCNWCS